MRTMNTASAHSIQFQSRSLLERLKLKFIRNREDEGVKIPHWWLGRAYRNYDMDHTVYLVIPFNILTRITREWLIKIRFPNRTQFELDEAHRFHLRRLEFENVCYEKFLYNMVGKFTRKEMDLIEDLMLEHHSEKYMDLLSDIHFNYRWLHDEHKDALKVIKRATHI